MNVKLYVEGGGDSKALKTECRKGFRLFLEKAGLAGKMPGIVACGSRLSAYGRFTRALAAADAMSVLLVDAETAVTTADPWAHLNTTDGWARPNNVSDDQCHLMVEIMESWFLADKETLASFYGQGFQMSALPGNRQVEQIPKAQVFSGLDQSTRNTQKGTYRKGSHSFEILAKIDPTAVEEAAPYAKRFLDMFR